MTRTQFTSALDRVVELTTKVVDQCRGLDFLTKVEPTAAGLDPSKCFRYSPSGDRYLRNALQQLKIAPTDRILDVGCGKGSAMRIMLEFPFADVHGIDLAPDFIKIAARNFERIGAGRARVFTADATEFSDYNLYNFIYFYNPFPADVMTPDNKKPHPSFWTSRASCRADNRYQALRRGDRSGAEHSAIQLCCYVCER